MARRHWPKHRWCGTRKNWCGTPQGRQKWIRQYFTKMRGEPANGPVPRPDFALTTNTVFGAFLYILCFAALASTGSPYLTPVGSFGATAILVFASPAAAASQPRCVVGGQVLASFIGVGVRVWLVETTTLVFALPFGVAFFLLLAHHLQVVNPPAGGTVAIAISPPADVRNLGWALVVPCFVWGVLCVVIAVLVLNINGTQRYPKYWWKKTKVNAPPGGAHKGKGGHAADATAHTPGAGVVEDIETAKGHHGHHHNNNNNKGAAGNGGGTHHNHASPGAATVIVENVSTPVPETAETPALHDPSFHNIQPQPSIGDHIPNGISMQIPLISEDSLAIV